MPYVPEPWSFDDTPKLTKISPAYWRATFNAPPLNLFTPRTYKALRTLVELLENDPAVKVVVFDSSAPDYFIAHYEKTQRAKTPLRKPNGLASYCALTSREGRLTAAQYGYVNRAIEESELSAFVDNFARRVSGFDRRPLMETKQAVNDRAGVLSQSDIRASLDTFAHSCTWPEAMKRVETLFGKGLQQDGPLERDMGQYLHEASIKLQGKTGDAQ